MHNTAMLRKNNMLEVLKVIRGSRLISRPEIAQQTSLTSVTVNTLIGELMKNCIVLEGGFANSIGGRKAMLYRFNERAYHIIGINMKINHISIDLFDLDANRVFKGPPVTIKEGQSVESIISAILRNIHRLIDETKSLFSDIIGIGMTVPGRADDKRGVVCRLPNLKNWVNIPLKEIIEADTRIPTYIERDTNSHMYYLKWLDFTENKRNVVYCSIGEGVGASVMIEGSVYHGEHGLAGEMGHTTLDPDGPKCNCGNNGCVEVYTSNEAIIAYYKAFYAEAGMQHSEVMDKVREGCDDAEVVELMARCAQSGDIAADKALKKASKYVCACIVNMINSYNPSLIILECKWMKASQKHFDAIVTKVFEKTALLGRNDMKILLSPVEDIFSMASSSIVLEQLFSDVDNNRLIG